MDMKMYKTSLRTLIPSKRIAKTLLISSSALLIYIRLWLFRQTKDLLKLRRLSKPWDNLIKNINKKLNTFRRDKKNLFKKEN